MKRTGFSTVEQLLAAILCIIVTQFALFALVVCIRNTNKTLKQIDKISVLLDTVDYIENKCNWSDRISLVTDFYVNYSTVFSTKEKVHRGLLVQYDESNSPYGSLYYNANGCLYRMDIKNETQNIFYGSPIPFASDKDINVLDFIGINDDIFLYSRCDKVNMWLLLGKLTK